MSLFGTGRREGILAVLLLATLAIVIHLPGIGFGEHRRLLRPELMAPGGNPAPRVDPTAEGGTNQRLLYPALRQAAAVWQDGDVPLWNPSSRFGEPFAASGAPLWYPPYWIVFAGGGPWTLDLLLALHSVLACVGMYRFLRVMPMSRYVSFLGGGVYGLGWFMTASLDRLPEAAAAAILPFALECVWHCLSTRRSQRVFVPGLGIAVAAMFATGSTTTAWIGFTLCAGVLVVGLGAVEREHRALALRMAGVATISAVLMSAPVWLDWLQNDGAYHGAQSAASAPRVQSTAMVGALAPNLLGDLRGHGPTALRDLNPTADPLETVLYPGAFVLFACLLGLLRPKRSYQKLFWLLIGGAGLVLTIENPLHDWIGWAPDRPGAALVLFHLAAIVLAGMSLETFLDNPLARRHATSITCSLSILFAVSVILAGLLIPAWGDAGVAWLTGITAPSEIQAAREYMTTRLLPPALCLAAFGAVFLCWRRFGMPRFKPLVAIIALADVLVTSIIAVPHGTGEREGERLAACLPTPTETHVRTLGAGRSSDMPPASWLAAEGHPTVHTPGRYVLARSAQFLEIVDPSAIQTAKHRSRVAALAVPELLDDPLLEVAAVGRAVTTRTAITDEFQPISATPGGAVPLGPQVLMSVAPRPRVRLTFDDHTVPSTESAVHRFRTNPDIDATVTLLQGRQRPLESKRPIGEPSVEILEDRPNCVRIRADLADGRGHLVLADAFAPGWHATVDGAETPIRPADLAFRAVALREGVHEVVFEYRPWSWRYGAPLGLLGLLLIAAYQTMMLVRLRRRDG